MRSVPRLHKESIVPSALGGQLDGSNERGQERDATPLEAAAKQCSDDRD
jgi:hypothetical protein